MRVETILQRRLSATAPGKPDLLMTLVLIALAVIFAVSAIGNEGKA
jgi:hypothetical protein